MQKIKISTIGFTKKPAQKFFALLKGSGAKKLFDVRLNNVSQLAGFAKRDDLSFFAKEICDVDYVHMPSLAPTQDMLDSYKKGGGDWPTYERRFLDLMSTRRIEERMSPDQFQDVCLLCSEDKPHHCHRRLVVDYLESYWGGISVKHLA